MIKLLEIATTMIIFLLANKVEDYYADPNVNFGEGVKINFGSTDPAQALGQNVNVSLAPQANNQESFRTQFLAKLQNTKYDILRL